MINYFRVPLLSILLSNLTLLRVMQAGMIAVVIPLVISAFTNDGGERPHLGFLNSGRFQETLLALCWPQSWHNRFVPSFGNSTSRLPYPMQKKQTYSRPNNSIVQNYIYSRVDVRWRER